MFSKTSQSQSLNNLVPNYSAENYTFCPTSGQITSTANWFRAAFNGSADYYSSCTSFTTYSVPNNFYGSQSPRTGNAYFGFLLYAKEFETREDIETKLKETLQNNKTYCVTYYLSLAEVSRYAISTIGAYFTNDSLKNYYPIPSTPSFYYLTPSVENSTLNILADTLNWMQVQGTYTATGGENFITITNFANDANTNKIPIKPFNFPFGNGSYYYIDDISVVEINPAKAYPTKTIVTCANTTYTLGTDSTFDATYQWQPITGLSCTNCPNPVTTVTSNIKYVLTKQQCSATTKDSITITVYTPFLTANAGPFKNICLNDTIKLGVNDTTAYTSYTWQPFVGLSCTNCAQPVTVPLTTTTYTLNKKECSFNTKDTVTVKVETCEVIIPDIFTPNNDNINDEWKIKLPNGFKLSTAAVYNRWGTLVYSIDDEVLNSANSKIKVIRWDGRTTSGLECSEGVYFYVIHYTDKNGILYKKKGNLTLIR
ncbi:MAG: gliding motility-associated C-terminal domain-containing protein [Bacteroidetes bacterium]|nr:gliding motility-associated C-terminal domain-containing protein [Bacteroidota bacterium]